MSTEELKLVLTKRELLGKKAKSLTNDDQVLGNVYGKDHASVAVAAPRKALAKVVDQAGKNHPIELDIDGEKLLALVSDIERHNITQAVHHVSFHIVKRGQKVHAEIPIHLEGEAPALRTGKILITLLDSVEVEADATKLPDHFTADVSGLIEEGDTIHLSDIKVSADVEILADLNSPVVKVDVPRAQVEDIEADEAAAEAAEAAEGEATEAAGEAKTESTEE